MSDQSRSSIGVDFDFLEECDDELPLWELWEPCELFRELPPILLFSGGCECFAGDSFSLLLLFEGIGLFPGDVASFEEWECLWLVFFFGDVS